MTDVRLRSNRRIAWVILVPLGSGLAVGMSLFARGVKETSVWDGEIVLPLIVLAAAIIGLAIVWRLAGAPRLAQKGEELLIYLRWGRPIAVPLRCVECMFIGGGRGRDESHRKLPTHDLIVRIAERCQEWSVRRTAAILGRWSDGYVVIRGLWCEPLSVELVQLLNERLAAEKHRLLEYQATET